MLASLLKLHIHGTQVCEGLGELVWIQHCHCEGVLFSSSTTKPGRSCVPACSGRLLRVGEGSLRTALREHRACRAAVFLAFRFGRASLRHGELRVGLARLQSTSLVSLRVCCCSSV